MKWMLPAVIGLGLIGCQGNAQEKVKLENQTDKVSYSIGLDIGKSFKSQGVELNAAALAQGIKDGLGGGPALMTEEEMMKTMEEFQNQMMAKHESSMSDAGSKNKTEGDAFLAENKGKPGVTTTASGLQYKVVTAGTGPTPKGTPSSRRTRGSRASRRPRAACSIRSLPPEQVRLRRGRIRLRFTTAAACLTGRSSTLPTSGTNRRPSP